MCNLRYLTARSALSVRGSSVPRDEVLDKTDRQITAAGDWVTESNTDMTAEYIFRAYFPQIQCILENVHRCWRAHSTAFIKCACISCNCQPLEISSFLDSDGVHFTCVEQYECHFAYNTSRDETNRKYIPPRVSWGWTKFFSNHSGRTDAVATFRFRFHLQMSIRRTNTTGVRGDQVTYPLATNGMKGSNRKL